MPTFDPMPCPKCEKVLDMYATIADLDKDVKPSDGDITLCSNCITILKFQIQGDMKWLKVVSTEEISKLLLADRKLKSHLAIGIMMAVVLRQDKPFVSSSGAEKGKPK